MIPLTNAQPQILFNLYHIFAEYVTNSFELVDKWLMISHSQKK